MKFLMAVLWTTSGLFITIILWTTSCHCTVSEVEPFLIVSERKLSKISLDGSRTKTQLYQERSGTVALDFDYQQQMIYWIQRGPSRILRMHISGRDVQVLHNTSLSDPGCLAVDWVSGNLYWGDAGSDTIEVSKLDGSSRRVLVNTGLWDPWSMAVDVRYGYLYWSDFNNHHIERMGMDGTNRTVILKEDIYRPRGLTLDYTNDHIYWSNNDGRRIEFSNLDGTNRHTVVSQEEQFGVLALTLFEDHIYWTKWNPNSIHRADRTQGTNRITVITNLNPPLDIHVYHPDRQPVSGHPCQINNGGCSDLCLLSPGGGYSCSCPTDYTWSADNKQCMSIQKETLDMFKPNITFVKGVSEVMEGSSFTISCSIQPQYPGFFQLTFTGHNSTHTYTRPAVNHSDPVPPPTADPAGPSATFNSTASNTTVSQTDHILSAEFHFPKADHGHQGNYTCSYHIHVSNQSLSSESDVVSLTVTSLKSQHESHSSTVNMA